ncbi:nucleosome assembly protein [Trypanosoma rangeli]|uniref:Nucleosome assembly protein n=1 Tax=Trypanosoma rangeli TaxID=5698 RepID=A0A3R7KRI5_TRYRA|nr:nucleosome assembly protein [Trypanosoma rangeli]RNF12184.1 nucleosome assembly protein [Trypanosoma rangeli]|eukprot:RNF12184.1 nucleosome assembly protein [Trypanosoma rangeli]
MPARQNMGHEHESDEEAPTAFHKYFNTNYSEEFMRKLPERLQQRAKVLMHYHEEYEKLRKSFEDKETALRRNYDEVFRPFYDRRKEIVTGVNEPTDEEVAKGFPSEHEGLVDIKVAAADDEKTIAGLPGFWLRVLHNHVVSDSLIEEYDEPVLKHLMDVRSGVMDGAYGSFAVAFVFEPNEFFQEESLVLGVMHKDDGVKIIRSPPTWKPGKDVTVETVQKKVGGKRGKGATTKTITVPRDSFFNIFKEPSNTDEDDDDEESMDEQVEHLLHVLHTRIVPCAVNFYTGEAPDGSSDLDMDSDGSEDEEDEEEEEPEPPRGGPKGRGGRGGNKPTDAGKECKQQ